MKQWYWLEVSEVIRETESAVSLHFQQPSSGRIWYYAGQFVNIKIEIDGVLHYRSYSLSTAPQLDDTLAITVKQVPGGIVSSYLNRHAAVGMRLEVQQPAGRFYIETSVKNRRHLVLIGGGSGITPLMSILRSVLFGEPHSRVSLLYGNRMASQIIFRAQLAVLQGQFPNRLRVIHFLSQQAEATETDHRVGRIDRQQIAALLAEWKGAASETAYFLCGPEGLMEAAQAALTDLGIDKMQIQQEHFTGGEPVLEAEELRDLETREIELYIAGTAHSLQVSAGRVILDAALDANLPVNYSCRRGTCGTCIGRLRSGEVRMHFNEALPQWDVDRGYILMCQSYPLTDGVQIDVGE